MVIRLTPDEICLAAFHAVIRRRAKLAGLRADRQQASRSTWDNEIEGASAELAYSKQCGRYWSGLTGLKVPDCDKEEVRWTKHEGTGGLIAYPDDADTARLILMDGFAPCYRVIGWAYAREAKQARFRQPEGYYLVPRKLLRSIEGAITA